MQLLNVLEDALMVHISCGHAIDGIDDPIAEAVVPQLLDVFLDDLL